MKKNEFLKKIRIDNGLSRSKIAKILEVAPVTIEKYENDKLPIKSNLKYIQGICALYGYNPEIFNYDEIDLQILEKYKLTTFTKSIRKYLYFRGYSLTFGDSIFFIANKLLLLKDINNECYMYSKDLKMLLEIISDITNIYAFEEIHCDDKSFYIPNEEDKKIMELLIILSINKFKVSEFGDIKEYRNSIKYYSEFKNLYLDEFSNNSIIHLSNGADLLKQINNLEDNGLDLTIENIKNINTFAELENLLYDSPKHKEICTLLEYAPEPFKDKLLNKLKEYKKDIEEL